MMAGVTENEPRREVDCDLCGRPTAVPETPFPGQNPNVVFCPTCSDEIAL